MGQLEDMQVFIRVVEAGGIGRAAEQLGIAKSAVSRRLSELEQRLGTKLIQRTTRTASLTDTGRSYYEQAVKAVDHITEINASVAQSDAGLTGTLRVAVPLSFGLLHLSPVIDLFTRQHPGLTIQMDFSDRQIELVEEGFDLAIRIADLKDSSIQARKIAPIRHAVVASPEYLQRHGTPQSPEEMKQHDILKYGNSSISLWHISDAEGKTHQLNLKSKMIANNGDFLLRMAVKGHGISILPTFLVWQALASGELVQVLPDSTFPSINAYAVYPQNRFLPQRARLFIDFIAERFGDNPYWDQAL